METVLYQASNSSVMNYKNKVIIGNNSTNVSFFDLFKNGVQFMIWHFNAHPPHGTSH